MDPVTWLLGLGSLVVFLVVLAHLLIALVLIIPTWRICTRAGFSGALSLFHLVPLVGSFVMVHARRTMTRSAVLRVAERLLA